ncbi:MAG: YHS domain-containing protein, partial [Bradyrhizobium sp.]|nr:YHS domain-containing protein [Bradyrhizobium sp.]
MTDARNKGAGGCCGGGLHHDHAGHSHDHPSAGGATVRDPVCGMTVDPATSKHRFDHQGQTFHFCSAGCRTKFAADPSAYLGNSKPKAEAPEGAIYTCP